MLLTPFVKDGGGDHDLSNFISSFKKSLKITPYTYHTVGISRNPITDVTI